jgi:hypothetical protein
MHLFLKSIRSGVSLALALIVWTQVARGQATTSLRGTVTDQQGAAIPDATVTIKDAQTGIQRTAVTDEAGVYQLLQIAPGTYSLVVNKEGFSVANREGVELLVNTPATMNVPMQIAGVASSVNVEAEVAQVNTVDAAVGNAFTETQVRQLPLQTRNVVELLSLQPGVTQTGEVLGAPRDQNNITLDGVDVNDNQNSGLSGVTKEVLPGFNGNGNARQAGFNAALPVPLDSVEEFRVTVGGEGADQGRSSGGQVTLVTKSGTNQFHGSAYEFNRNTIFSANDWFNNQSSVKRTPLNRNQFGASIGGPVRKDRVFFFFNYEKRIDRSAVAQLVYVPSAAMRMGNLTFASTNGAITTLTPGELKQIDPNQVGVSPTILNILNQYPIGNNPSSGYDGGLNFAGFRFNAPQNLDNNAYVAKMDFHLDPAGRHVVSVRGTLAGNSQILTPQSFPGQSNNNNLLNNSRGMSILYTSQLRPTVVNVFSFGLTRIGLNQTGQSGPALSLAQGSISTLQNYGSRAYIRISPTYDFSDNLTWVKGRHTVTAGATVRFVRNGYTNWANAWPSYSLNGSGGLTGLGSDWLTSVSNFLQTAGLPSTFANSQAVARAGGVLLGVVASGSMNYSYDHSGNPLAVGLPTHRNFATNEYAGYVSDSWRVKPGLTITAGLRYENSTPPWETNGLQVAPTIPLQQYWAAQIGGAAVGIPENLSAPTESYALNGPANGKPSWYARINNNLAPRLAFAYSPQSDTGLAGKILGKGGVFRGGATIAYDRYGSDMVVQFDSANSFGLTENDILQSPTFTTANRYAGAFPALPTASIHTFPFTPPNVAAICCTYMGIQSDLKTPYSYVVNTSIARPLKGGLTIEVGYQGRFSHDLLMQIDEGGVNWNFTDPTGLGTLGQMEMAMRNTYLQLSGNRISLASTVEKQVAANPSLVPINGFAQKYFTKLANLYFPGSASANYLYALMNNAMSDTDLMNVADRQKSLNGKSFPNCVPTTGCWSFYAPQQSSLNVWTNVGAATYNGATITIRHGFSKGFSFDLNYTLSHAIDNGGGAEAGGGAFGGIMLDPYNYRAYRGSSDFDARHNVNANVLYQLPFGKGKTLFRNAGAVLDEIVGGWQFSMITRYQSGLPSSIFYGGVWPTNYSFGAVGYPINPQFSVTNGFNQKGNPAVFPNSVTAAANWLPMYSGDVGSRAAVRLAAPINFDIALAKSFKLPFEHQRLQLRAEAFNALNHANFMNPSLDASSPSTFGQYTLDAGPRVMQFGLRYEF